MSVLISIIESGGYADFKPVYSDLGYDTIEVNSVRKAISVMKKQPPQVIVAEFNFQSDFRDRTSSLETLLATVEGRYPDCKIVVLYEEGFLEPFQRLQSCYQIDEALCFPVTPETIKHALSNLPLQRTF